MARRIPHLSRIEFGKVAGLMDGSPAPDHRIAELYFADEAALGQAGGSEEGKAAFAHAGQIATGGLDAMVVQGEEGQSRP